MDGKEQRGKVKNPRASANIFSKLTFAWIIQTFWVGYHRDLEVSDLYSPLDDHTSSILGKQISSQWEKELKRVADIRTSRKGDDKQIEDDGSKPVLPSLLKVLVRCFGVKLMLYGIILAVMEILLRLLQPRFLALLIRYFKDIEDGQDDRFQPPTVVVSGNISNPYIKDYDYRSVSQPLFLARLLRYFSSSTQTEISRTDAFLFATGVVSCSAINIFVLHPYMMAIMHMGMKIRIACCTLIYRKALKLSKTALGETTIGQAVNLLSNDVNRFDVAVIFIHYLWIGPLETIIITYFMYTEVGISAIIGVASLLMFIPMQGFLGKRSSTLRLRTAIRTDERVRLTNEIITGIQAIKMYTWEQPFGDLVESARKREIQVITATSHIRGIIMSFVIFTTRFSLCITIIAYVLLGENINAEKVFMLTAYYNILRQAMTVFFPQGVTQVAEALVSIKRLQNFMLYNEVSVIKSQAGGADKSCDLANGSVHMENGFAKWIESSEENTLRGINLKIDPGQLVAIVGQVGSGKSSLLHAILQEMPLTSGTMKAQGTLTYASQEPWLFAGSVRQNILFGRKMDTRRYDHVIKVCQLQTDFTLFPYGDKTVVGERGVSLSGGQRARINLARAVYASADIYLMDDPLSAVDTHVGKHMFDECIAGFLNGKTRILVTHQLQYLRNVDRIIVLKDGAVEAQGTYSELQSSGIDLGRLLESQDESRTGSQAPSRSMSRHSSVTSVDSSKSSEGLLQDEVPEQEEAEIRSVGSIAGSVYADYFRAGGNWCIISIILALCLLTQFFASAGDYFVVIWVNLEELSLTMVDGAPVLIWQSDWLTRDICIYVFSALTILTIVLTLIRSFVFFRVSMEASKRLHNTMFRGISHATMRFFNTNSSGRILNRFSKDMGAIDELLPTALIDCIQIGLGLIGVIVVVGISNPWLMIITVVMGAIFYWLRIFYLSTSRSVKRLEGVTRSPVFAHLNATMQGLTTIRAFEAGTILTTEFDYHQDLHSSAWFMFIGSSRAFALWLDCVCVVWIALVTYSFLVIPDQQNSTGGNVGLAITQSIGLTGMFQWGMRQSAELENQMTSVERVCQYSVVDQEPPLTTTLENLPPKNWPSSGKLEFKELSMQYGPAEPLVLRNLNFVVESCEKIGIVGRTGAGKSSLVSALFRLAYLKGDIIIDDVSSGRLGLHDLRSKISIIPQEPFLFSGTLRRNLDPFDEYPDSALWQALEEVELKDIGLESNVAEGGSNLSVGQRQLVCLARAIVRNNKILILDEATANVDPYTDELIQKTIRVKFSNCTVLTVAHRLNTVMDSDKVLVMDAGTVVEFDHPHILLQKDNGYLRSMVDQTGKSMAATLAVVAKNHYKIKTNGSIG